MSVNSLEGAGWFLAAVASIGVAASPLMHDSTDEEAPSTLRKVCVLALGLMGLYFVANRLYALYHPPERASMPLPRPRISQRDIWEIVRNTKTLAIEGRPVVFEGRRYADSPAAARKRIFTICSYNSRLLNETLKNKDFDLVLDLGCGLGHASRMYYLTHPATTVIAIDLDQQLLDTYRSRNERLIECSLGRDEINPGSIRYFQGDITECDYTEDGTADVAICMDVLPYIPPYKLQQTLEKILRVLKPGGRFIGSFFCVDESNEHDPNRRLHELLGAHFYPGKAFAMQLLRAAGFEIAAYEDAIPGRPYHVEFDARNPITSSSL